MILKAIIVDDEEYSRKSLYYLLDENCPEVYVAGMAASVAEARKLLETVKADVVFLDIAMPRENGFELIPDLEKNDSSVIFTTAFDQYALKAIKASAIDYLLKPVSINELQESIKKVLDWTALKKSRNINNQSYTASLQNLSESLGTREAITKISLPDSQGFKIKNIADIMYISADNNYSCFYFKHAEKMFVSKSMKDFEDILNPAHFVRIHKSSIINLHYLKDYSIKNGFVAILINEMELPVSRRRSAEFLDRVKAFFNR